MQSMDLEEAEQRDEIGVENEGVSSADQLESQRLIGREEQTETRSENPNVIGTYDCTTLLKHAVVVLTIYISASYLLTAPPHVKSIIGEGLADPPGVRDVIAPTILISIDAFRHEYLQRKDGPGSDVLLAPNIYDIAMKGVRAENGLQPVVPTKTFPNHWSIVTGLYPENHGIVGNTMYDPERKKWFHLDRMQPDWWFGEPIWQTVRRTPRIVYDGNGTRITLKENYTSATVFWPGSDVPRHAANVFWKYDADKPYEDRVKRAVSLLHGTASDLAGKVHFTTIYFEGVDHAGHAFGPHSPEVSREIRRVDNAVGMLLGSLGKTWSEKYNIIIVSDHGMTEVSPKRLIDLTTAIKKGSAQDILTTPMGFFLNMTTPANILYADIKKGFADHKDHAMVYRKKDLPERWHLRESRLVTEVVSMATLGWTVHYPHQHLVPDTHSPLERMIERKYTQKGNHGFDNTYDDMQAIFVARGPAFRSGATVKNLRCLDMYEMLCHIFGARAAPNNGTLETSLSTILKG